MRSRGTRVDNLKDVGKPGQFRVIRFGNFMTGEESEEIILFNRKELENLYAQMGVILEEEKIDVVLEEEKIDVEGE